MATKTTARRPVSSRNQSARRGAPPHGRRPAGPAGPSRSPRRWLWPSVAVVVVVGALFAVFALSNRSGSSGAASGFQVGTPGIGQVAPGFTLPSSTGTSMSLSGFRGKTVLLYFQEGVGCEPCWTQMKDLEKSAAQVRGAGIDAIVSITTQPANILSQKARDEGISTPVLADTDLAVSRAYRANEYGMMGTSMDGHTFVLVGPDGKIQWRADYGGAPKYTMYVPPKQLLTQLQAGRRV